MWSSRPDPILMRHMVAAQRYMLAILVTILGVQIAGWLMPLLGDILAEAGLRMKLGTTLCVVAAAAALVLLDPLNVARGRVGGRLCAALAMAAGLASAGMQMTGLKSDAVVFLTPPWAAAPEPMTLQSAVFFALFGFAQLVDTTRSRRAGVAIDILNFGLLVLTIDTLASYVFLDGPERAGGIFGYASLPTLLCLGLITVLSIGRRAECCLFGTLFGVGIGSRVARLVLPLSVATPFLFVVAHVYLEDHAIMAPAFAAAATATVSSVFFFALVVTVARVVNSFERDLRALSLTDSMTGLFNTRGFELLGGQAMREAQRNRQALSVFFFDLDGLKQVNDRFGHDAGSRLIVDLANLLKSTFRGADIPARIGGDEFAVVFHDSGSDTDAALHRLELAVAEANETWGRPYRIAYSVGHATAEPDEHLGIAQLLKRADAQMYVFKRDKASAVARAMAPTLSANQGS